MSAEAIQALIDADPTPDDGLACLVTLIGPELVTDLAAAIMACLDGDAVKQIIVDCLTNPDTNPITKEFLAEVIRNEDLDDNGVIGLVSGPEESPIQTSTGIKVATVTFSRKVATEGRG